MGEFASVFEDRMSKRLDEIFRVKDGSPVATRYRLSRQFATLGSSSFRRL